MQRLGEKPGRVEEKGQRFQQICMCLLPLWSKSVETSAPTTLWGDAPTRACFAGRKCLLILMWCLFLFLPKGHSASWGHFSRTPEENSEQYPGDESTDEPNSVCGGLIDMCPPTPLPCGPAPLCPCMSELQFLSVLHGPETGSCSEDHGNRKKRPVINNEKSPRASRI